ncbi:TraU family protein [Herbaspirillum huttiense]|uniref:TraU family protein n=1 Tax=Herbaspirillum huttiense TaxID=863372 RepID=UPI002176A01C|nr:TraU family protein [Herbaspirillum huttiense]UWE19360.1 TraU family protein [Herbaspirillum huttiense]
MRNLLLALIFAWSTSAVASSSCQGAFPNLITDVCYDCMFPITISGLALNFGIQSEDYDTTASGRLVCVCVKSLSAGLPTSFWEPEYMVDVTNKPGCMPMLGGVDINPPYNDMEVGDDGDDNPHIGGRSGSAFMHVNEYLNPVMTAMGVIADSPCLDTRGFDVPFISWADPTWNDDSLSMILTPYGYAFAGIPSIAAEAPDAISATFGFPSATLFWVAGSWGPMYPVTGNVSVSNTPEQIAHLLVARLFAKLHAAGALQSTAGKEALESCGALGIPEFLMDKRQYKTNRTFPFPDNMCTPIGRPLPIQETGAARPNDKDYGYFIFRKKDCCTPIVQP